MLDKVQARKQMTRNRSGSTDGGFKQNEVQALIVPADFKGTYYLRWDFRTTKLLRIEDGPQEIAAALNRMFTGGAGRFDVSNPEANHAYIEFTGELGSAWQHADGRGFNIPIETVPLDGRISLRVPTEKTSSQ